MSKFSSNDSGAVHLVDGVALWAPLEFWQMSEAERRKNTNACGPCGLSGLFVPNFMWGLDVSICCSVHDSMYSLGEPTNKDKEISDRVFGFNLERWIVGKTRWSLLRVLRMRRANFYVTMVRRFGGSSFWKGKNKIVAPIPNSSASLDSSPDP